MHAMYCAFAVHGVSAYGESVIVGHHWLSGTSRSFSFGVFFFFFFFFSSSSCASRLLGLGNSVGEPWQFLFQKSQSEPKWRLASVLLSRRASCSPFLGLPLVELGCSGVGCTVMNHTRSVSAWQEVEECNSMNSSLIADHVFALLTHFVVLR